MDKNKMIIAILAIIIVILVICIGVFFIDTTPKEDIIIYNNTIDGVGTFNTTNVTNFTLANSSNDLQTNYVANDTIAQVTTTASSSSIEVTTSEAEKVNDSVKGHTIYKNTANIGEHKGDVRYFSVLKDNDNERYVLISTDNHNLTGMMVDTFKFLN